MYVGLVSCSFCFEVFLLGQLFILFSRVMSVGQFYDVLFSSFMYVGLWFARLV